LVSFHFSIKTVRTALRFSRRLRCPLPLLFSAQCIPDRHADIECAPADGEGGLDWRWALARWS